MAGLRLLSLTFVMIALGYQSAWAQPPRPHAPQPWGESRLSDDAFVPSSSARQAAADAAARSRRERAAYQARQRMLRSEANAWMGVTPLRPTWPSTPSTHSYYQARRIIFVPLPPH